MYLEYEAFYKSYHNIASPEGVRLIRQGVWVLLKCPGFFFYFCIRVLVQKNPARTTPLVSAVLPTKVISVCVPLDSRVGLARKVKCYKFYGGDVSMSISD